VTGRPPDLLGIGRFAAATGLTVTTLRHYDDVGLLPPAHVDPATGYRWYAAAQARRAGVIRRLRAVDVPLDEVAAVLDALGDPGRVRALLDVHERRLADRAAEALARTDTFAELSKELQTMPAPSDTAAAVGPVAAVRLFVRDLDAARTFYGTALGLTEMSTGPGWAVFDGGPVQIVIEDAHGNLVGRFAGISFAVEDAQAACDALAARGVTVTGRPAVQPWGGTLAHVADPDGNVLTLVQYPPA
jgi:DNA-binding transcriptional MerR regulator/catechol 2,3-dioxygenase-like lactoylglutathione lyase family enzyme